MLSWFRTARVSPGPSDHMGTECEKPDECSDCQRNWRPHANMLEFTKSQRIDSGLSELRSVGMHLIVPHLCCAAHANVNIVEHMLGSAAFIISVYLFDMFLLIIETMTIQYVLQTLRGALKHTLCADP